MRRERTELERLTDGAVLLALWARAQEASGGDAAGDRLKTMKLAFLAAYPLYVDRVKALNLRFFRWKWGPMADQVYDTLADLARSGVLVDEECVFVTEEGLRLVQAFRDEVLALPENAAVLQTIEDVAATCGGLDTAEILEKVYEMRCYTVHSPGRKRRVRSLPEGTDITRFLEEDEAEEALFIPPGWELTLELALDPGARRNLQRGIEDTHEGRVYGWEAVGTDV